MKSIQWVIVAAVAFATAAVGCDGKSQSGNASPVEPTPAQIQAAKEWQSKVDEAEKSQEKLGLRDTDYDPNLIKVRDEELEHRRETKAAEKAKHRLPKK